MYPVNALPPLSKGVVQDRTTVPEPTDESVGGWSLAEGGLGGAVTTIGGVVLRVLLVACKVDVTLMEPCS